jgi:hypothetical protein
MSALTEYLRHGYLRAVQDTVKPFEHEETAGVVSNMAATVKRHQSWAKQKYLPPCQTEQEDNDIKLLAPCLTAPSRH